MLFEWRSLKIVVLQSSEDMLSESPGGSSESIGGGKKRNKESRDSFYLERSPSSEPVATRHLDCDVFVIMRLCTCYGFKCAASAGKEGKNRGGGGNHKRQRSWGGNKGDQDNSAGCLTHTSPYDDFISYVYVFVCTDTLPESAEFQVVSLDGKVWELEASSSEETGLWVKAIEEQIKKIYSENVSHKRMVGVASVLVGVAC